MPAAKFPRALCAALDDGQRQRADLRLDQLARLVHALVEGLRAVPHDHPRRSCLVRQAELPGLLGGVERHQTVPVLAVQRIVEKAPLVREDRYRSISESRAAHLPRNNEFVVIEMYTDIYMQLLRYT